NPNSHVCNVVNGCQNKCGIKASEGTVLYVLAVGTDETCPDSCYWKLTGNTINGNTLKFLGTRDSADLIIKTNSFERMRIKADGAFIYNSQTGSTPDLVNGKIMMYNPDRGGAFRVGEVSYHIWDNDSIGNS